MTLLDPCFWGTEGPARPSPPLHPPTCPAALPASCVQITETFRFYVKLNTADLSSDDTAEAPMLPLPLCVKPQGGVCLAGAGVGGQGGSVPAPRDQLLSLYDLLCLYIQPPLSSCRCLVTPHISSLIISSLSVAGGSTRLTKKQNSFLPSFVASSVYSVLLSFISRQKVRGDELTRLVLTDSRESHKKYSFLPSQHK